MVRVSSNGAGYLQRRLRIHGTQVCGAICRFLNRADSGPRTSMKLCLSLNSSTPRMPFLMERSIGAGDERRRNVKGRNAWSMAVHIKGEEAIMVLQYRHTSIRIIHSHSVCSNACVLFNRGSGDWRPPQGITGVIGGEREPGTR